MLSLEGVPTKEATGFRLYPENYTGERNANEVACRRKLYAHFTGILGFKERRQKELTANGERKTRNRSETDCTDGAGYIRVREAEEGGVAVLRRLTTTKCTGI